MVPHQGITNLTDRPRRIPELDGLRGMAIGLVVLYHYVKNAVVGTGFWYSLGLAPLRLAWSGVDLFFVLSGFLIGGILLEAKNTDGYFRAFYGRRFFRIFPLYYIWLIPFGIGLATAPPFLQGMFNLHLPLWSYLLFLQNFLMVAQGTFGAQWLFVTWSLAVEEQFYLILPLLIRKLELKQLQCVALLAIVGAPLVRTALALAGVSMGPRCCC